MIKIASDSLRIIKSLVKREHCVPINDNIRFWFDSFRSINKESINIIESKVAKKDISFIRVLMNRWNMNREETVKKFIDNHKDISLIKDIKVPERDYYLDRLMYDNPFVSFNVIEYLENNDLIKRSINKDNIEIVCYEKTPIVDILEIFRIVKVIKNISKRDKKITIVIAPTNFKKQLFEEYLFNPVSINSGSSYMNRYINIWRYEEMYKVLIHELIHFLELDLTNRNRIKPIEKEIRDIFKIDGVCNPGESYAESVALILHTVYVCSKTKLDHFPKMFNYEINFSLMQCRRLMDIFETQKRINQTTSVVNYYFIKTCLILNTESFFRFLRRDLDFNNRYDEYLALIRESVPNLNIISGTEPIKNSTLRMSCIQII